MSQMRIEAMHSALSAEGFAPARSLVLRACMHSYPFGAEIYAQQSFYPLHAQLAPELLRALPEGACFDLVLIHATRSKAESLGLIAEGAERLTPEGWLLVDGFKTDGIEAIERQMKRAYGPLRKIIKAHGRILAVQPRDPAPEAWREAAELRRNRDGFFTQAGMFKPEGVDQGSQFLAEHLPALSGEGADLGAGWGYLSAEVLRRSPAVTGLTLMEAEACALEAARRNISDPRAAFLWCDVARSHAPKGLDFIVMNPPFHQPQQGRDADLEIGRAFISAAGRLLARQGQLWLVANRHLSYERHIGAVFAHVEEVALSPAYKIILAKRPRAAR